MSSFPSGPPGYGLLLLRIALAVVAIAIGIQRVAVDVWPPRQAVTIAVAISGVVWIVASLSLILGLLIKRVIPVVVALEVVTMLLQRPVADHAFYAAVAMALMLLGPGAYSADARLYGRSEIIIRPPHGDNSGSRRTSLD